jgi:hypothetical protein
MSTQDFVKVLCKDDRLMVTDQVRYAVIKGGANMTCAQYNAIGSGGDDGFKSNIVWNVQVPSQETLVSRQALIETTLNFSITATPVSVDADIEGSGYVFAYGSVDGFSPFPFHALVNSTQWTINNNTISQNTRDLLAVLVRLHDKRYLQRYNGMTPTMFDVYGNYSQIPASAANKPFGSFADQSYDNDLQPRGSLPVVITGTNYLAVAAGSRTINVKITVTEPCMLSPFIFAGDEGQAMYGIQNFNATYNLSSAANNVVRFGGVLADRYTVAPTVTFVGAIEPRLLLQYLTPHPSDLLPSRNVLPYYELPRYLTAVGGTVAAGATSRLVSSSLQLNQVPDKLYICVSRAIDSRLVSDADSFLPIKNISINWNNAAGILSSATQQDLWRMSIENGINMSWAEWSGATTLPSTAATGVSAIQTCGPILCLEFGKDIELRDDYYSAGSLGNFNLQFTMEVVNNTAVALANYQLMVIVQNSGVFSLERGVSSSYLGILTKSDVLEASRGKAIAYSDAIRMVGGGKVGDFFKRVASKLGDAGMAALPALKDMAIGALKKKVGLGQSGGKRSSDMGSMEDRLY